MAFFGCQKCPSTLYKTAPAGFPNTLVVFAGCLDDDDDDQEAAAPQAELWVKYRLPWIEPIPGAKQCREFE
jgi:hypothetical protein